MALPSTSTSVFGLIHCFVRSSMQSTTSGTSDVLLLIHDPRAGRLLLLSLLLVHPNPDGTRSTRKASAILAFPPLAGGANASP